MRLTIHTDYALRVLLYLAAHPDQQASTEEISTAYGISLNHLVKVVHELGRHGYLDTKRGRGGGIMLAKPPEEIVIGNVVRDMEPDFFLVECFRDDNKCVITPNCRLAGVITKAFNAFRQVLDATTLADVVRDKDQAPLRALLDGPHQ
jgi:Rrf2 family nitric oxide-sensitive transcriptional repressor